LRLYGKVAFSRAARLRRRGRNRPSARRQGVKAEEGLLIIEEDQEVQGLTIGNLKKRAVEKARQYFLKNERRVRRMRGARAMTIKKKRLEGLNSSGRGGN